MSDDPRDQIRAVLGPISPKLVEQAIAMLDKQRLEWAFCDKCREKVRVDYPDYKGWAKLFEMLVNQGWGKPAEQKQVQVDVSVTHRQIQELSDVELLELASAEDAELA